MRMKLISILMFSSVGAFAHHPCCQPAQTGSPIVELRGTIERVMISPDSGMPYLDVKADSKTNRVYLGSVRYLLEKNFNPQAGSEVTVKAYKVAGDLVAAEVSTGGTVLKLRDAEGRPLWSHHHAYRGNHGCWRE